MNKRIGSYITKKIAGEIYKAFVPPRLPPIPPLDLNTLYPLLEKATSSLAELNTICKTIPNTSLFIYMYVRKEALLSSQIEGTQSSFSDLILFEHKHKTEVPIEDVEEVSNYVKAITYGLDKLKNNFPFSLRLLREIHAILLSGVRGSAKLPGEFRTSQNWIGGTKPGNALFVPPPVDQLNECLSNLEEFLHYNDLPILIKAGLAHMQFETIHPFLDGNGRLGRLMITLILCNSGMLDEPILYLSLYLKQNRNIYYELLQETRSHGKFETWLEFFLQGVYKSSKQAIMSANLINKIFDEDAISINKLGRARFTCLKIFDYIKKLPQVTVSFVAKELAMSAPTVRQSLESMAKLGILQETSGKKRDKIYVYRKYLQVLEKGAEPI